MVKTGEMVALVSPWWCCCCPWLSISTSLTCCCPAADSAGMTAVNGLSAVWRITLVAMALHCDPAAVVSCGTIRAAEVLVVVEEMAESGCGPGWLMPLLPGRAEQSLVCGKTERGPEKVWTVVVEVSAKLGL